MGKDKGMALGGIRYRSGELIVLMLVLVGAFFLGVFLLNSPHDPDNKILPALYFSDHWRWEPGVALEPRGECWGGLLFALAATIGYAGGWRKDRLARHLALWGILAGALGFPLGQSVQAFHAWNPEVFRKGLWVWLDPHVNWWNMMETTFGAVMGGVLGLGLWLNRKKIRPIADTGTGYLPAAVEWTLLAVHLALLVGVEFLSIAVVDALYDLGPIMVIIPIVAVAGGRWWPWLVVFPVTLVPIAGKTVRLLVYGKEPINPAAGWLFYLILPLLVSTTAAIWCARKAPAARAGRVFARRALLLCTWVYFFLNFAVFRFPWPWAEWTARTPNGIIFAVCALALTVLALTSPPGLHRRKDMIRMLP